MLLLGCLMGLCQKNAPRLHLVLSISYNIHTRRLFDFASLACGSVGFVDFPLSKAGFCVICSFCNL
jgi:hypothetical protein